MSISVRNIVKTYGQQRAVNDISFEIPSGEIVGFIGPNGAGKSTTMKIITGYLSDFEGEVLVNGKDVRTNPIEVKREIGYLPEHNPLYPEMYVREYLCFVARMYGLPWHLLLQTSCRPSRSGRPDSHWRRSISYPPATS